MQRTQSSFRHRRLGAGQEIRHQFLHTANRTAEGQALRTAEEKPLFHITAQRSRALLAEACNLLSRLR